MGDWMAKHKTFQRTLVIATAGIVVGGFSYNKLMSKKQKEKL